MDSEDNSDDGTAAGKEDPDGFEWTLARLQKYRQEQDEVIKHLENRLRENEPGVHRLTEIPL